MATISNTPRPGYAWDATDNCWYPIGTGPHTHSDYITQSTAINPATITTKGDLIVGTGNGTLVRQGVGSDGQVLTADSAQADGVAWTTLSTAPRSANSTVATQETTTSGSYAALSTAQSVTLTTGTKVLVILTAQTSADNSGNQFMSFAVSGATTVAASDANALINTISSSVSDQPARTSTLNFLTVTAGSNTFTAQFKQSGGNAKFANRQITVIDLGS